MREKHFNTLQCHRSFHVFSKPPSSHTGRKINNKKQLTKKKKEKLKLKHRRKKSSKRYENQRKYWKN